MGWAEDSCIHSSRVASSSPGVPSPHWFVSVFLHNILLLTSTRTLLFVMSSQLSRVVIPIIVLPWQSSLVVVIGGLVLGVKLVGIGDVPIGIESLWSWF